MTRGPKVGDRSRNADAGARVARPRANSGGIRRVVVRRFLVAGPAAGLEECEVRRLPVCLFRALYRKWAARPVEVAAEVLIRLELAMVRQQFGEAPLRVAHRGPFVKV